MVRKNFFITEAQQKWVVETSEKQELAEVELIRRILDYVAERKEILDEIMYRRTQDAN